MSLDRIIRLFGACLFFFLFILPGSYAQFFTPFGAPDQTRSTAYGEDTIFVFHADNENKILGITHSTDQVSDFTWSRFNKNTETYDSLFTHKDLETSTVRLDSLYQDNRLTKPMEALQVQILNTDDSLEIYRIWTILDTFPEMGEISIYQEFYTCQTLWLKLDAFSLPEYTYYKLSDSTYLDYTIPNTRNSEWTASEDVDIFTDNLLYEQSGYFVGKIGNVATVPGGAEYEGPYKDSDYYLTVTNSFGNSRSDTIFEVVAKAVKADFTVNKIDETGNEEEYSEGNINEALLQVGFENKSENEQSYHWIGYNDSLNILRGGREILWENFQETPSIDSVPQYPPGKYPVKLIVDNEFGCVDSMTFYHVKVDSSSIDSAMIPNVFTPNGDDRNDIFVMPKKDNITGDGARGLVSMKTIEVTILNRSGQLVYKYDGNPNNWNGWDGKVRNGNRDAEEGIYLYVIRGTGYDGVVHESKNYTGFLYLFR